MATIQSLESLKPQVIGCKPQKSLKVQGATIRYVLMGIGILLVIGFLFYNNAFAGLLFSPYLFFFVKKQINKHERNRREKIAIEFKDAMQAVVASLIAGYSIENSFRESLFEIEMMYGRKAYIYKAFGKIVNQLNVNINIEEAFEDFARESRVEEIESFAQVLKIAKHSGGNLIEIIRSTTDTISEKIDVKREISTIIRSKQLEQKIMEFVPLGIIIYMRLTSPAMFDKLYGNAFGIVIMTICLIIYVVAKTIAEKIVDIPI